MSLDPNFISLLSCPNTQQGVALADESLLSKVNDLIAAGQLRNRNQDIIQQPLEVALLREDGQWLFPVINNIPVLLAGEAIDVKELNV